MVTTITDRVSGLTSGQAQKVPCVTVSTSNITLTGLQTINGATTASGDRVLVAGQTDQTENGIWNADTGDWTRATDFDGYFDVVSGTLTTILSGSYEGTFWKLTTADPVTIGTSNLTFSQLDVYSQTVTTNLNTIYIPASAMTPRSSNGCAALATTSGSTGQPDIPYLAFDGASTEYAGFSIWMPKSWDEGTVKAQVAWRRASGTGAANVVFGIKALAVSNSDSPAASFGTGATVTTPADTTTGDFVLSATTGSCTIGGSPAESDLVFFELYRLASDAADTLDAVDAWVTGIKILYSTDATSDA